MLVIFLYRYFFPVAAGCGFGFSVLCAHWSNLQIRLMPSGEWESFCLPPVAGARRQLARLVG